MKLEQDQYKISEELIKELEELCEDLECKTIYLKALTKLGEELIRLHTLRRLQAKVNIIKSCKL